MDAYFFLYLVVIIGLASLVLLFQVENKKQPAVVCVALMVLYIVATIMLYVSFNVSEAIAIAGVKIGAVYGTGYIVYQLIKGISD
jgi:hypothetical protein